jgi:hypothetical protein
MRHLLALATGLLSLAIAADAPAQSAAPPHAWLFGAWTGGLYPVTGRVTAQTCLAQPTVIFMRDVVLRATLADVTYVQRVVATARTHDGRTDFTFAPVPTPAEAADPLARLQAAGKPDNGFGCASPDELHVQRQGENEIVFPGCADFPNPLVRCPSK